MMTTSVRLTDAAQALVDARLDTIDRMLLGRVPRADRLEIVREVEAQIVETLQGRDADEIGREDVLAVLAKLDPPEAYLPDEADAAPGTGRLVAAPRPAGRAGRDPRVARASGILGLATMGAVLLLPLLYLFAMVLNSEEVLLIGGALLVGPIVLGGMVAVVLGLSARLEGVWAVLGVVAGLLAVLLTGAGGVLLVLLL